MRSVAHQYTLVVVSLGVTLSLLSGCPATGSQAPGPEPLEPEFDAGPAPNPSLDAGNGAQDGGVAGSDAGELAIDDGGTADLDAGPSDIQDAGDSPETLVLEEADYRWIAASGRGTTEQLQNLSAFLTFNVEGSGPVSWTDAEILVALNAFLFNANESVVGDVVDVSANVYSGSVSERTFTINVTADPIAICGALPCPDAVTLGDDDYAWIVGANKGSLAQLNNLAAFNTFLTDNTDAGSWSQPQIDRALGALLLHHRSVPVGTTVTVTYAVYTGTAVETVTIPITVTQESPFDVVPLAAVPVAKGRATSLYVHYMPWFTSRPHDGYWGSHWTMANRNPDSVDANGKREIASHYYPLIGPYSSSDPHLVDYHLLLMKFSGIDGVLIDWYGTYDVYDYAANLAGSNALIERTDEMGLEFGIVYEDRTTQNVVAQGQASTAVEAATTDFIFLRDTAFNQPNYIHMGGAPLLLTFTPIHIETEAEWLQVLADAGVSPTFLAIWFQGFDLGAAGAGEFSWVSTQSGDHLGALEAFYRDRAPTLGTALGSAYPGFRSFYQEGGWSDDVGGNVAHEGSNTLANTLALASAYQQEAIQLVTWNDFGEGTMLEPTEEFGYSFLTAIQTFAQTSVPLAALEDVTRLYLLRKAHPADTLAQQRLDQVTFFLRAGAYARATFLLDLVEGEGE